MAAQTPGQCQGSGNLPVLLKAGPAPCSRGAAGFREQEMEDTMILGLRLREGVSFAVLLPALA